MATFAGPPANVGIYHGLLDQFLSNDDEKTQPTAVDKKALRTFLTSVKTCSTRTGDSEYMGDHEAKMALIPQVYAAFEALSREDFGAASYWTALWMMPTGDIQELLEKLRDPKRSRLTVGQVFLASDRIPEFVRLFRGLGPTGPRQDDGKNENADYTRDRDEVKLALERDNRKCVITDTPCPQVCHIFPFASMKHGKYANNCLTPMTVLWGEDRVTSLLNKLTSPQGDGHGNVVDTVANMICLSPQLQKWWEKGFFALEPMEEPQAFDVESSTPTRLKKAKRQIWSIRLRFHWLRKTDIPSLISTVNFSDDPVTKLQEPEGLLNIVNATTWRPVDNGQVITITADSLDRLPDYDILLLQWDLLRMWRLAGGADPNMYPFYDEGDDIDDIDDGDKATDKPTEKPTEKQADKQAESAKTALETQEAQITLSGAQQAAADDQGGGA
ncbi:hypothetical protein LZ30DRAFT_667543 [Colletotrichum cereale]|nr:hypothetical protein LZ30DRAFT_667543 [Colletotrichum cereale]